MNSRLTIKIKKRSQMGWICWLIIMLPFLFGTLNDLLGLPWAIRYILDAAWLVLLLLQLLTHRSVQRNAQCFFLWSLLFLIYTLLAYLPQYQSAFYYLWGVRNNFRFYAVFLSFCMFLTQQDIDRYFDTFDMLFWINVFISLVQFFVLEIDGDCLGGIFGSEVGSNGYTNIFFCIILTKAIIFYLEKREPLRKCFAKFIAALLVTALAEIKFFFIEAILVIVLAVLFTSFSWRKVWITIGGLAGILLGAYLLVVFFPNSEGFLSLEWLWENAASSKGYTASGDMNRLNAISVINERFLKNGWAQLFGLGMGNCDTSAFAFLNTPFSEQYSWLHYSWMSYAFMYLECGWIGLIFFFGFFVMIYFKVRKIEQNCEANGKAYCRIARIMAVLCAVIAIYNSSLRTEAAYMAYFVLAAPFCLNKR